MPPRPCQPGHVMEGAAHDYSVASHKGLNSPARCTPGAGGGSEQRAVDSKMEQILQTRNESLNVIQIG